jgi:hypothetical protein
MTMSTTRAADIRKGIMCARWYRMVLELPKPKTAQADSLYKEAVWLSGEATARAFKRTLYGKRWDNRLPSIASAAR